MTQHQSVKDQMLLIYVLGNFYQFDVEFANMRSIEIDSKQLFYFYYVHFGTYPNYTTHKKKTREHNIYLKLFLRPS